MRYPAIILCLATLLIFRAQAQQNNVWAFGDGGGLNFNTDPVSTFKSKTEGLTPPYYVTSICDAKGNLLFYTDGLKSWNRDQFALPIYKGWWPWADEVMPLVCTYPGRDALHYFFGIGKGLNDGKLIYLTTKMHKAGDIEEMVYPRPATQTSYYTTLLTNASFLLAGTTHCNQKDIWLVAHTPGSLNSFLITENGVNPVPVVTSVPTSLLPEDKIEAGFSNLKFSANGEKLMIPLPLQNKLVIYSFNNATGTFYDPLTLSLPEKEKLEDAELSVEGSKVYIGSVETVPLDVDLSVDMHYVSQLNLDAGTPAQIENSSVRLNSFGDRVSCLRTCFVMKRTLQLAPDGKIYVSMRYTGGTPNIDLTLSVIENPNKLGLDARYRKNTLNLKRQYRFINYNYIRSSSFPLINKGIVVQKKSCVDQPVNFGLLFTNIDSVKWDFGDVASGENNYSVAPRPQHLYPGPGEYRVKATIFKRCLTDTATTTITVQENKAVHVPASIKDTVVCIGEELKLNATVNTANYYEWENGLIFPDRTIAQAGQYAVTVGSECSVDKKTFIVAFKECPCLVFVPNAFTPNQDGHNDNFKPTVQCSAKNYRFKIFSRYGDVLFETRQLSTGWNGKKGEAELPSGVYVWLLQYEHPVSKATIQKKGTVALIR